MVLLIASKKSFRDRIIDSSESNIYIPKENIEKFLGELAVNIVLGHEVGTFTSMHRRFLRDTSQEIFQLLNPIVKDKNIRKSIKKTNCIDILPFMKDDEKYKKMKELMKFYIKEFCVSGFLYYAMKRCILDDNSEMYTTLAHISDSRYPFGCDDNRSRNLRSILAKEQYNLFKLNPWLLLFVDVEDTMITDKHLRLVCLKLGNILQKYNNIYSIFINMDKLAYQDLTIVQ